MILQLTAIASRLSKELKDSVDANRKLTESKTELDRTCKQYLERAAKLQDAIGVLQVRSTTVYVCRKQIGNLSCRN